MRKKNFKGKCEKRIFSKCKSVCKTYDAVLEKFEAYKNGEITEEI